MSYELLITMGFVLIPMLLGVLLGYVLLKLDKNRFNGHWPS